MSSRRGFLAALSPFFRRGGAAVILRVEDGAVLRVENENAAASVEAAPGSALKPWMLEAVRPWRRRACTGVLRLAGHRLDCIHAPFAGGIDAETALAASCNQWFAAAALDAGPQRIYQRLLEGGAVATMARTPEELQLQALGLEAVSVTAFAVARIYRRLALEGGPVVRRGLRRALTEGTAQAAGVEGIEIAGKTGTSRDGAWFGGFAPAARPAVALAVFQPGGLGPRHAAPVAAELFRWARSSGQL